MNLFYAKSLVGIFLFSFMIIFQNCSNARFSPNESLAASTGTTDNTGTTGDTSTTGDTGTNGTPTCQPRSVTGNKNVKVLFVLDTSGSNGGDVRNTLGTDPDKKWRASAVNNFIAQYKDKTNFYYGLITFQGTTAQAQIKEKNCLFGFACKPIFSNEASVVQSGVDSFMQTQDAGATPYRAALSMVKDMISAELKANADPKTSYVMVMVSDGKATDYGNNANNVIPDAAAIKALAPSQITLNTVYYYPKVYDEANTLYLKNISKVGEGVSISANSNQSLSIDDVIQLPPTGCE